MRELETSRRLLKRLVSLVNTLLEAFYAVDSERGPVTLAGNGLHLTPIPPSGSTTSTAAAAPAAAVMVSAGDGRPGPASTLSGDTPNPPHIPGHSVAAAAASDERRVRELDLALAASRAQVPPLLLLSFPALPCRTTTSPLLSVTHTHAHRSGSMRVRRRSAGESRHWFTAARTHTAADSETGTQSVGRVYHCTRTRAHTQTNTAAHTAAGADTCGCGDRAPRVRQRHGASACRYRRCCSPPRSLRCASLSLSRCAFCRLVHSTAPLSVTLSLRLSVLALSAAPLCPLLCNMISFCLAVHRMPSAPLSHALCASHAHS